MPRGHLTIANCVKCATCDIEFLGKHYQSKYCSSKCEFKNKYQRNRVKELNKGYRLQKKYKLTLDMYNQMVQQQNGNCLICLKATSNFDIDHCHTTQVIRGLLCRQCNLLLGMARDDIFVLTQAINYLKKQELKKAKGL